MKSKTLTILFALIFIFVTMFGSLAYADGTPSPRPSIEIMKQPGDSSTYNGYTPYTSTWFSVKALGAANYYWQIQYTSSGNWYTIPSPDVTEEWTDGLILTTKLHLRSHQDIVDHVGCRYRCVLVDANGNEVITSSATIRDNPPPAYTPEPPICPPICPPIIIAPPPPHCQPNPPVTVTTTTTTTTTIH